VLYPQKKKINIYLSINTISYNTTVNPVAIPSSQPV